MSEKAYAKLEAELHRTPSDEELASELSMSDDQLQSTLSQISQISFIGLVALDEARAGLIQSSVTRVRPA